jgi:hypothetical protein
MVLVSNNWRLWLLGLASSLIIFAVVFFTVIQPAQNQANQALKSGLQQSQQVINQAQKQLKTSGAGGTAAGSQAQQTLSKAAKLTACVQAAGTDPSAVASCQSKYGH